MAVLVPTIATLQKNVAALVARYTSVVRITNQPVNHVFMTCAHAVYSLNSVRERMRPRATLRLHTPGFPAQADTHGIYFIVL